MKIFVFLFLASCAAPLHFRMEGATVEEASDAADKISAWNSHTDKNNQLVLDPKGEWLLSFVDIIHTKDGDMLGRECSAKGEDCERGQWVRVVHGLSGMLLGEVILHELGHSLKLKHLPQTGTLMYPITNEAGPVITTVDHAECARVNSCDSAIHVPTPEPLPPSATKKVTKPQRID